MPGSRRCLSSLGEAAQAATNLLLGRAALVCVSSGEELHLSVPQSPTPPKWGMHNAQSQGYGRGSFYYYCYFLLRHYFGAPRDTEQEELDSWGLSFTGGHSQVGMEEILEPRSKGFWVHPPACFPRSRSSRETILGDTKVPQESSGPGPAGRGPQACGDRVDTAPSPMG